VTGAAEGDRFSRYMGMAVGVGALGFVGAYVLPRSPEGRLSAFLGVAGSALAGTLALALKRRAMARGLNWALGMLAAAFGLRMVLVGVGLVYVMGARLGAMAFTVGFFSVYLVLQWIEITYVMAEARRRGRGGPE
jgi:hypothetical protein